MDFQIASDQAHLVAGVREYFAGTHGPEILRALDATESRRSVAVAAGLSEMGLPGLVIPETCGGLGLSLIEATLIAVECGRAALAEPLVDSAFVAAPLLARSGGQEGLLTALASGEARIALYHPVNPWIADLKGASHLISVKAGGLQLGAVPDAALNESVDPLRRLYAPVDSDGERLSGDPDLLLDLGALMAAAQAVGAAEAMLSMAVEYAKVRNQFGQPIGAFQAVKHHLATCAVAVEFARPTVLRAAMALSEGLPTASIHVSHAKVVATDAANSVSETAIQVHGAMGYTYEVDLHFWMKRAWALAGAWGSRAFHLRRVAAAIIEGGHPIGPSETFA